MDAVTVVGPTTAGQRLDIRSIQFAASNRLGVSRNVVLSGTRMSKAVRVRHIGMYLAREAGHSYPKIAQAYRREDHTTVLHAYRKIRDALAGESDPQLKLEVEAVRCVLGLEPKS